MLTLNLTSDGAPGDEEIALGLEYNLGVRVVLHREAVLAEFAPHLHDEPHPVLEKEVVHSFVPTEATQPVPSFQDLLNQQVPPTEVTESSP